MEMRLRNKQPQARRILRGRYVFSRSSGKRESAGYDAHSECSLITLSPRVVNTETQGYMQSIARTSNLSRCKRSEGYFKQLGR
jgi:hypothetical protein